MEWIDCKELLLRNSQEWVESLWVKTGVGTNEGQLVVRVYFRPPDQEDLLTRPSCFSYRSFMLTGCHPDVGFQPPGYLLAMSNPGDSHSP